MPGLNTIQWKALFMLAVFTANLYAFCHCHHSVAPRIAVNLNASGNCPYCHKTAGSPSPDNKSPDSPSSDRKSPYSKSSRSKSSNGQNGCCTNHALLFGLLAKQTAKRITLQTSPSPIIACFAPQIQIPTPNRQIHATSFSKKQLHKYPPPDLLAFYQRYQI